MKFSIWRHFIVNSTILITLTSKNTMDNSTPSLQQQEYPMQDTPPAEKQPNSPKTHADNSHIYRANLKEELKKTAKGLPGAIGLGFLMGVLDVFFPMIGSKWFWLDKKIIAIIHTIVCAVIIPLIVYTCLSAFSFAGICAFIVSWISGWAIYRVYSFISLIMELIRFINVVKEGPREVIKYILMFVIVGGFILITVKILEGICQFF